MKQFRCWVCDGPCKPEHFLCTDCFDIIAEKKIKLAEKVMDLDDNLLRKLAKR